MVVLGKLIQCILGVIASLLNSQNWIKTNTMVVLGKLIQCILGVIASLLNSQNWIKTNLS